MTQPDAVKACVAQERARGQFDEARNRLVKMIIELHGWCESHERVEACRILSRSNDLIVTVLAKDEDDDDSLHRQMSMLEVELCKRIPLSLHWILFRHSEREGWDEFSDNCQPLSVYSRNAERQAS